MTGNLHFAGRLVKSNGQWVVTDRLGSVVKSGTETLRYFPWGEERTVTAQNRDKFGTYHRDSSGLDYALNRYYSSSHGRFLTPDPWMGSAGADQPQSWNRYTYVLGDPVNSNDPTGLAACDSGDPLAPECQVAAPEGANFGSVCLVDGLVTDCALAIGMYTSGAALTPRQMEQLVAAATWSVVLTVNDPGSDADMLERVKAYLDALGLWEMVEQATIRPVPGGITFNWSRGLEEQVKSFLQTSGYFGSGWWGGFHYGQIGGPGQDYRSWTGPSAPGSLQLVWGNGPGLAYADVDRFNPYQDLAGLFGHFFGEVIPPSLGKILGWLLP